MFKKLQPFILTAILTIAIVCGFYPIFSSLFIQFNQVHFSDVSFAKSPEHQISVQTVYYSVTGKTANELRSQLNQRGVIHPPSGQCFDGYTNWRVNWNYRYQTQGNTCRVGSANVSTNIKITLPKWKRPSSISSGLKNRWNRYIAALEVHENGHKKNGLDAGKDILQTLRSMSAYPTCEELGLAANVAADEVIKIYNQKDIEYDRVTEHGRTQGARFP